MSGKTKVKRKKMIADAIVRVEVFDVQIGLYFSLSECNRTIEELGGSPYDEGRKLDGGCTDFSDADGYRWYMMYLSPEHTHVTIWHECLHAAWAVLDNYGVGVEADNHEILAYVQEHVAQQVIEAVKQRKKNGAS